MAYANAVCHLLSSPLIPNAQSTAHTVPTACCRALQQVLAAQKANDAKTHAQIVAAPAVGETSYAWSDNLGFCTEQAHMRASEIAFQRYNAVGVIQVIGVEGTIAAADLRTLSAEVARLLDMQLTQAATGYQ